ncbi:MAG: hypothetical protein R3E64_18075 [Halioglobus sp.]
MKLMNNVGKVLMASVLLITVSGCQKSEGPAEKAGKSVDEAAQAVGDKVEDAGEAMQDAAEGK